MRLVEAVACELQDEIEECAGLVLRVLSLGCTGHKQFALLGHGGWVFLTHGAAQQIGAAKRIAGDDGRDLHHLFLVHDDAKRLAQQVFEFGQHVLNRAPAPFTFDEVIDHAALDGAGTIECVERGQVFDGGGLVASQHVAHAARFKLEDTGRQCAMEDLFVRHLVVEIDSGHVDGDALVLLDELETVVDDSQRGEPKEVHLEQAHLLDGLHIVCGDEVVGLGECDGDKLCERLWRDDDACCVDARSTHKAFEAHGGVDDFTNLCVALVGRSERW